MTSINAQTAANYYSLTSSTTSSGTSGTSATTGTGASSTASSTSSVESLAYYLNLSSEAQTYLSAFGTSSSDDSSTSSVIPGLDTSDTTSTTTAADATFTLNQQQQESLSNILAKYKDAPYTQDTYDQIQNDLTSAGLDTDTLGAQDRASSTNLPMMLLDALNGTTTTASTGDSDATIATKSTNYMDSVLAQWKSISTTAATSDTAADGTTADTTTAASA